MLTRLRFWWLLCWIWAWPRPKGVRLQITLERGEPTVAVMVRCGSAFATALIPAHVPGHVALRLLDGLAAGAVASDRERQGQGGHVLDVDKIGRDA